MSAFNRRTFLLRAAGSTFATASTPLHAQGRGLLSDLDFELPPLPGGGEVIFADDLLGSDFASDSGFRSDGRPCWQSRLARTRQQAGNKELGYYADPALNPEVKVWGIEPSTGHRFIQAEHVPQGLSDGRGGKITLAWQKDAPVTYTAAMVTSRTLFNQIGIGSYVEFEVKLSKIAGSWPALWLLRAGDVWPPEIDVMEAFISSTTHPRDGVTTNQHWIGSKGHASASAAIKLGDVEPGADIFARFNRYGCYLGEKEVVWYFNRKPYRAMINFAGAGPWYMLMDVAVGGLVPVPSDSAAFPAPMHIRGVRVVQF